MEDLDKLPVPPGFGKVSTTKINHSNFQLSTPPLYIHRNPRWQPLLLNERDHVQPNIKMKRLDIKQVLNPDRTDLKNMEKEIDYYRTHKNMRETEVNKLEQTKVEIVMEMTRMQQYDDIENDLYHMQEQSMYHDKEHQEMERRKREIQEENERLQRALQQQSRPPPVQVIRAEPRVIHTSHVVEQRPVERVIVQSPVRTQTIHESRVIRQEPNHTLPLDGNITYLANDGKRVMNDSRVVHQAPTVVHQEGQNTSVRHTSGPGNVVSGNQGVRATTGLNQSTVNQSMGQSRTYYRMNGQEYANNPMANAR